MALPRQLTPAEKISFHNDFPLLDVDFTIVTDEPSGIYNCISWTVGVTNYWHWPGSLLSDFDNFYNQFGYTRRTKGTIAAWGQSDANMTHGCVSGPTHGPCWESKCGSWARIQHCLNELNGPVYGHVIAYYGWKRIIVRPQWPKYFLKYIMEKREYSREEMALLNKLISTIPAETRKDFEKKFKAWKSGWMKGAMSSVSDPYARTRNAEFRELTSLGKSIVPLLANKLMDESNFLALPAFEKLAGRNHIIPINSTSERIQEGEQGRAYRTVKQYLAKLGK